VSHWTRRYAVPFFVSSLTAFVLAAAALLVVVVSRPLEERPEQDCLIGSWRVVSYWERDPALRVAKLELQGDGHLYEYRVDGTGRVDFGDGVRLSGELLGAPIEVVLSGYVEFHYTAEDGVLQVVGQDSNITARMWGLPADDVIELSTEPYHYRCEKDRLRQSLDDVFAAEMTRVS